MGAEAAGIAGAGIGLLGMTASMIMEHNRRKKAERALARMGSRPKMSVSKEVMSAYQNRLTRSKKYQGFSQAEVAANQSRIARANAGLGQKMLNAGGSAQAVQTGFTNQNANANVAMAAESARMNRAGQAADLNASDALAGQVGRIQNMNEQQAGIGWDSQVAGYGNAILRSKEAQSNMLNTVAGLGFQGAIAAAKGTEDGSA